MIPFTPKTGRLIRLEGFVSDDEAEHSLGIAMTALQERGARDVLHQIVKECMTVTPSPMRFTRLVKIEAVVMSEAEYRKEVENAYLHGLNAGRKAKS